MIATTKSIDAMIAKSCGHALANIRAHGSDAEPADLDADAESVAPKARRRKGTSPTARTLAECRKRGWIAQVVERYNPHAHVLVDLFGVIDLVVIVPRAEGRPASILGIQATANNGGTHAARRDKIMAEPRAAQWVEAGARLELWSWAKQGKVGKRKVWTLRVETYQEMCDAANEECAF